MGSRVAGNRVRRGGALVCAVVLSAYTLSSGSSSASAVPTPHRAPAQVATTTTVAPSPQADPTASDPTASDPTGPDAEASPTEAAIEVASSLPTQSDAAHVAYVNAAGQVVVSLSDGSQPIVVGENAARNAQGLAPLSWRQPGLDAVTYVRTDGALVVAPIDGNAPLILATDAVVPPDSEDQILSWEFTGSLLAYLSQEPGGEVAAKIIDFTEADDVNPPDFRTIGSPTRRRILAQQFSPLDPFLYQRTVDRETGDEYTMAIVEPVEGTIYGTPLSLDDPTFSPDGRFVFAVAKGIGDVDQLIRLSIVDPVPRLVTDRQGLCQPSVSPDSKLVVFAVGERCEQVWVIGINGADPKRIDPGFAEGTTFAPGNFTWSLDSTTVSHTACTGDRLNASCTDQYWDIAVSGGSAILRSAGGSVAREQRPLLRPIKIKLDLTGPVKYSGKMRIGSQSAGKIIAGAASDYVETQAVDEADSDRSFTLELYHPSGQNWISGSLRIADHEFDESFVVFGRILPQSYGFMKLRGIWIQSGKFPMKSGQFLLTLER